MVEKAEPTLAAAVGVWGEGKKRGGQERERVAFNALQALRLALRRRSEQLELTGLQLAHNRPVPLCLVPRVQTS
jgi:hypothetical protein